jgi:hypothetical protein
MTDQHLQDALKDFNAEHQDELKTVATTLQRSGLRRIHFGVDFVNDDGAPSDYAVYEYTDGRVVEQADWPDELDYGVFGFGMSYCQPYTFDIETASVRHDTQGGQLDLPADYALTRSYHSAARLLQLEAEAEEIESEFGQMNSFNEEHAERLSELAAILEKQGIETVYFGIDAVGEGDTVSYPLSDWCFVQGSNYTNPMFDTPQPQLAVMVELKDLWDALPQFGAFVFNVDAMQVEINHFGGSMEIRTGLTRSYFSQEQLQALLDKVNNV